jgi:thioredoxin-like negative regulator of GroEL
MSGLLFLTGDDFHIQQGLKGPIMCTKIRGFSLVLFYSTKCQYCQNLVPIFKRLPGSVGGCQFGMINVSHNRRCVMMSHQTIAPITEVPFVILYVDGKPYLRYRGPHDGREIVRFIMEVNKKIRSGNNATTNDSRIKQDAKSGLASYVLGQPLYGDDDKVCYLEFDVAYNNETKQAKKANHTQQHHSHPQMQQTYANSNDPSGMGRW